MRRVVPQMDRFAETLLRQWLPASATFRKAEHEFHPGWDLVAKEGHAVLVIELKRLADPSWLKSMLEPLRAAARKVAKSAVPVVVVPFMAEGGKRVCAQSGISWFDLSGNADITAPGLRI